MKRYLLTTVEQCLTFIKNLPPGEKLHTVKPYPGGYEVLVDTEEKIRTETEITVIAKNYNILRIRNYIDSGLGGYPYPN
jgi:hypothetical protein